jgi:hypothetical protein
MSCLNNPALDEQPVDCSRHKFIPPTAKHISDYALIHPGDNSHIIKAINKSNALNDTFQRAIGSQSIGKFSLRRQPGVVRILSQNMHARPLNPGPGLSEPCNPALHFHNRQERRVPLCGQKIRQMPPYLQPDVVCFQELQDGGEQAMDRELISKPAGRLYPSPPFQREEKCLNTYQSGFDMCVMWPVLNCPKDTCLPKTRLIAYPGGLFTYSRLPVMSQHSHIFTSWAGAEYWVNKGVIHTQFEWDDNKSLHVFNCHPAAPITFTDNFFCTRLHNCTIGEVRARTLAQLREIHDFCKRLERLNVIHPSDMVVFCGDFNMNRYTALWETPDQEHVNTASVCCGEEFYTLLTRLEAEQPPLYPAPEPYMGGHGGIFSWDGSENAITQNHMWPKSFTLIDYVLFSTKHHEPYYADNMVIRIQLKKDAVREGYIDDTLKGSQSTFYRPECMKQRSKKISKLLKLRSPVDILEKKAESNDTVRIAYQDFCRYAKERQLCSERIKSLVHNPSDDKDKALLHYDNVKKARLNVWYVNWVQKSIQALQDLRTKPRPHDPIQLHVLECIDKTIATHLRPSYLNKLMTLQQILDLYALMQTNVAIATYSGGIELSDEGEVQGPIFNDVSDHYAIMGTFIHQDYAYIYQAALKARHDTNASKVEDWMFFGQPVQPAVFGVHKDGTNFKVNKQSVINRHANRFSPHSPKMAPELWKRQVYVRDKPPSTFTRSRSVFETDDQSLLNRRAGLAIGGANDNTTAAAQLPLTDVVVLTNKMESLVKPTLRPVNRSDYERQDVEWERNMFDYLKSKHEQRVAKEAIMKWKEAQAIKLKAREDRKREKHMAEERVRGELEEIESGWIPARSRPRRQTSRK